MANLNSTLKNLGALCDKHGDEGTGSADLSNLKRLLENSEQAPLSDLFAQLKADLSGSRSEDNPQPEADKGSDKPKSVSIKKDVAPTPSRDTTRGANRLQRVMAG